MKKIRSLARRICVKTESKGFCFHADQRQKQNHKEDNLLALHQELFPLEEGIGLTLNQGGKYSFSEHEEESNVSSSSFTTNAFEKKTGRFISGE